MSDIVFIIGLHICLSQTWHFFFFIVMLLQNSVEIMCSNCSWDIVKTFQSCLYSIWGFFFFLTGPLKYIVLVHNNTHSENKNSLQNISLKRKKEKKSPK